MMTVIRSFGNAEDATMIVITRVIILIILMIIVIIVIAFIIVIMSVIIIIPFFYLSSYVALGTLGNAENATMMVIMTSLSLTEGSSLSKCSMKSYETLMTNTHF